MHETGSTWRMSNAEVDTCCAWQIFGGGWILNIALWYIYCTLQAALIASFFSPESTPVASTQTNSFYFKPQLSIDDPTQPNATQLNWTATHQTNCWNGKYKEKTKLLRKSRLSITSDELFRGPFYFLFPASLKYLKDGQRRSINGPPLSVAVWMFNRTVFY